MAKLRCGGLEKEEDCVESEKEYISGSAISVLIISFQTALSHCNARPVDRFSKHATFITNNTI